MNILAHYARGLGLIVGGVLFWLIYFDLKDRYKPEPRRFLIMAFILGTLAAVLSLFLYIFAEKLGLPAYPFQDKRAILLYCFLLVGPIEEGTKFIITRVFVFRWKAFDEPIDGMVYAAAVAIGFASVENILYMPHIGWIKQIARVVASPLAHSLFASIWGFGVSRAFFSTRSRSGRFLWQAGPLILSMALHGLYDFFLLAHRATYMASGIVLVMWIFLIIYARRLLKVQKEMIKNNIKVD